MDKKYLPDEVSKFYSEKCSIIGDRYIRIMELNNEIVATVKELQEFSTLVKKEREEASLPENLS